MKFKILIGAFLGFALFQLQSCKEEEASDLENSLNNNTDNGDNRSVFLGHWNVSEASKKLGARNYSADILKDANFPQRVNIFNFYNLGFTDSLIANVASIVTNTITIPNQVKVGNEIGGSGTYQNSKITFTYTVKDGSDVDTIVAVYSR